MCLPRLDAVILNHAAFQDQLLLEYESSSALAADVTRVLQANVVGSASAAMEAIPVLAAVKGRLVFVSSGSVIVPPPSHAIYAGRYV